MEAQVSFGWLSILPALIAISLCILTRNVILSLFLGIFSGVLIMNGYHPLNALLESASDFVVGKGVANSFNAGLIVFCLVIGGMVGVINKSGGMTAVAQSIAKKAKSRVSSQIAATILGIAIFIDDYASCVITGNTMRPVTDAQKVSREKLSFITDATAAAISSVIPVSTWIAMELGLIQEGLASINIKVNSMDVFFQTIPYRFYVLFLVVFMFSLFLMKRDYGSMYKAEMRAITKGELFAKGSHPMYDESSEIKPETGSKGSIWGAIFPILIFIFIVIWGLRFSGLKSYIASNEGFKMISETFFSVKGILDGKEILLPFREILGNADVSSVLVWASVIGSIVSILFAIFARMKFAKIMEAWIGGVKSMVYAVMILVLALSLKAVMDDIGTAKWLVDKVAPFLNGALVPLIIFLIACVLSFATGTSWGTMAILMPIAIPIAWKVSGSPAQINAIMVAAIGSVLGGAIYGDHCSPISDTTILASLASGSDHMAHVNTQLPYATTVALAGAVFGYLPFAIGIPVVFSLVIGAAGLILFVRFFGKPLAENSIVKKAGK